MRSSAASMSEIIWRAWADRARSRSRSTTSESPSPDSSSNCTSPGSRSSISDAASPSRRSAEPRSLARSSSSSSCWPSRNLASNGEAPVRLGGSVALAVLFLSAAGAALAATAFDSSFLTSVLAGAFLTAAGADLAASFLAGTDFFGAGLAIRDWSFRADGVGGCYADRRASSTTAGAAVAGAGSCEQPLYGGIGVIGIEPTQAEALGPSGLPGHQRDIGRLQTELGGEQLHQGSVGSPVDRRRRHPDLHGVAVAPRH